MMRGTFANIRIKNQMVPGVEGGVTIHYPDGEQLPIYDAAMRYRHDRVPLVVFAGREYGAGSSRDWAAKGTMLLGVEAVVAESFERIHRSNLVNMGVLPLQFLPGQDAASLKLTGRETYGIAGIADGLRPRGEVIVRVNPDTGAAREFRALVRIDTPEELVAFRNGGILPYVLRQLVQRR
jgi:aconitate hydratase